MLKNTGKRAHKSLACSYSEEIKQNFKDYLQGAKFGTLKYLAFCDYFDRWLLEDPRRKDIKDLAAVNRLQKGRTLMC